MSEHLPECFLASPCRSGGHLVDLDQACRHCGVLCICPQLRAYGERLLGESPTLAVSRKMGYRDALIDAREAVAAARAVDVSAGHVLDESRHFVWMHDALAAIDKLLEGDDE